VKETKRHPPTIWRRRKERQPAQTHSGKKLNSKRSKNIDSYEVKNYGSEKDRKTSLGRKKNWNEKCSGITKKERGGDSQKQIKRKKKLKCLGGVRTRRNHKKDQGGRLVKNSQKKAKTP